MVKINTNSIKLDIDSLLLVQVLDQLGSFIYIKDINRRYVYANSLLLELYNKTSSSIIGCIDDEFFNENMLEEITVNDAKVLNNKKTIDVTEKNFIKNTNSYKVYHSVKQPIVNSDGIVIGLFGVSTDISDIYNTKEKLKKQKQGFETFFEDSSDGISIIRDGKFIKCNLKLVSMLKYNSKEDILNIHPSKLSPQIQPDGRYSFEKAEEMMKLAIRNHGYQFEWMHTRADGEDFWAEITLTPMILDNSDVIHVIWRDISDRKKKEEILIDQTKLVSMGEMIGNIAHQWRQPLNSISLTSGNLKFKCMMEQYNKELFEKELDLIDEYSLYLSKTIDDFRNFIQGKRNKEQFRLKDNIKSFIQLVQGIITTSNINLILDIDKDIKINGYSNELIQCLINIFNNAKDVLVDKKIKDKLIFISTSTSKDRVIVKIKDNGGGIPEDIINKIFEPYFTTKHQSQGTGLGLHMTYNLIVDGMGGTIEANNVTYKYNDIEYTGAEFIISLPTS